MVNPSPTHAEIDGDIVKLEDLVTRQKPKVLTSVLTHGMALKHRANPNENQVEEITADATVRPVFIANVTEANDAGNGAKTVHVVEQGWLLLKTKEALNLDDKLMTDGTSKRFKKWNGAAGADVATYKGHLNEGDRKFMPTSAAIDDLCLVWYFGGRMGGDAVV